ncbi:hypothetical protein J0895_01365 [Phormidium pseudopriestleyi FRX01]|uniref:Uncharacterized protein n=1 Tax=Phormidium pseudopriestleyi FRX01 TaxID=1759528 RepID=A0ABS3FLJ5_9CYAN|nr:hypothetical protein [Phormidium pseudopriestleyi]MBO0347777.1 hypothetical protein [Phormidium pseudopriestleyi FRX01]
MSNTISFDTPNRRSPFFPDRAIALFPRQSDRPLFLQAIASLTSHLISRPLAATLSHLQSKLLIPGLNLDNGKDCPKL